METIYGIAEKMNKTLQVVSGLALVFVVILTDSDVILRMFGHPIVGTFEMASLAGALVIAFAIPMTSWLRGHIYVDFFYQRLPKTAQKVLNVITRLIGIAAFGTIAWNLFLLGFDLYASGEVTPTRHFPFYPVAYGLALCCFVECLVLVTDICKIFGGTYE